MLKVSVNTLARGRVTVPGVQISTLKVFDNSNITYFCRRDFFIKWFSYVHVNLIYQIQFFFGELKEYKLRKWDIKSQIK